MDLNLAGQVAVVTGAGKGIGLAVTRTLAGEGALVVAGSRTTENLDGFKGVSPVALDLSAPDGNLTKTLSQEFGPHGIRVNAVSPGPVASPPRKRSPG